MNRIYPTTLVKLEKIVGGGQTIATMDDGRKIFVWGGLPGETVRVQITKIKSKLAEGIVTEVINASPDRVEPLDKDSYLSTSPWQIMSLEGEQSAKANLIHEAFDLSDVKLPNEITIYTDSQIYGYRNKLEFSWWWDNESNRLDLAFFRRGSHGKLPVDGSSLANSDINQTAIKIRDLLRDKNIDAYSLKTLLIRSNRKGAVSAQLYVKNQEFLKFNDDDIAKIGIDGFEIIYSNPKSPASVITSRLQSWGITNLTDDILGVNFKYAVEGFFQINLPVYEQALIDIKKWTGIDTPVVDLYSGVGTIGLVLDNKDTTLVEINEHAYREMVNNIELLGRQGAKAVLSPSEAALEYISRDSLIIVDPPRAGLDAKVTDKLLVETPSRIIYLSCNPVTQARDVSLLGQKYRIAWHRGYNFFPRTPHIEHLVILDLK
ncbi:class I SAM-dependent RNA methyltransferase [Candidatus Saccharibacteria bacterium]|nr:class I SAM-dependent RNA methyltransferase [Candidatus Saccharibacteria bacterium]